MNHPNATSEDLKDVINPTIRRKPDTIIVHIGTNDITQEIDTIANLNTIMNRITKKSSNSKVFISSVLMCHDKPHIQEKVKKLNTDLKLFCDENLIKYINNDNLDNTCLGKGNLHPNNKGKAYLAKTFIHCINDVK